MSLSERHVQLMQLLRQHHRPVSAQSLAKALGVSLRSIYRDVESLRALGAKLHGAAGVGYSLEPGLMLPALVLDEKELEALLQALRQAKPTAGHLGLVAKFRAVLPTDLAHQLAPASNRLGQKEPKVPAPGASQAKGPNALPASALPPALAKALAGQLKLRVLHGGARRARSERVLWPVAALQGTQGPELLAWCELSQSMRAFRLGDLYETTVLSTPFEGDREAWLAEWLQRKSQ